MKALSQPIYFFILYLETLYVLLGKFYGAEHYEKMSMWLWTGTKMGQALLYQLNMTRETIYIWRNTEARQRKYCCSGKVIIVTFYECVCVCVFLPLSSGMKNTCTVLYWHTRPVWLYHIFHSLKNRTIFRKKKLLHIKCVFWFSLQILSDTFLIPRRIQRDIVMNVRRASCKVPVVLVRF